MPRPAPAIIAKPAPPPAAPEPLPLNPPAQQKPAPVPKVPLKSLPPDQRRELRERFMVRGLQILFVLGLADIGVWLVPVLWMNLFVNIGFCVANLGVIGFVLSKAQSHLSASANELSEYEKKRVSRVLLGLFIIFIVPLHEVLGIYPLGYTGTWSTYGPVIGMVNPLLMLGGALMVAFNIQQSRERLGYFVIWRNGALFLVFPPLFGLVQTGVPFLVYPEWFHATLGMVGGTVMAIALVIKRQRDRQFAELENALRLGEEYAARGQTAQAIAQYDSAINTAHTLFSHLIFNPDTPFAQVRVPPAYGEPWFRKARVLMKLDDPRANRKALAIFEMIIEMDPQNQVALLNEAELLSHLGEHEQALRAVDRVLSLVPNHPDALKLRPAILEGARLAAETREKETEAEDAESVFGPARPDAAPPAAQTAASPPPGIPPPEEDFETI